MKPITIHGLEPYVATLDLQWQVEYFLIPTESTCRITCDQTARRHEIWVHPGVIRKPDLYACDLVHELCHARLAETVDPAFATVFFSSRYANLSGKAEREFALKYRQMYFSWAHVDIWVDELRHFHFPELTATDHIGFYEAVSGMSNLGKEAHEVLAAPENLLAIAVHLAEIKRLGLARQDFSKILNQVGRTGQKIVSQMTALYTGLPRLTFEPQKDLMILSDSVRQAAAKLGFAFAPRIVEEKGRRVWLV